MGTVVAEVVVEAVAVPVETNSFRPATSCKPASGPANVRTVFLFLCTEEYVVFGVPRCDPK